MKDAVKGHFFLLLREGRGVGQNDICQIPSSRSLLPSPNGDTSMFSKKTRRRLRHHLSEGGLVEIRSLARSTHKRYFPLKPKGRPLVVRSDRVLIVCFLRTVEDACPYSFFGIFHLSAFDAESFAPRHSLPCVRGGGTATP